MDQLVKAMQDFFEKKRAEEQTEAGLFEKHASAFTLTLPRFDGSSPVDKWFESLENLFTLKNIQDPKVRIHWTFTALSGRAKALFEQHRDCTDWKDFVARCQAKFLPPDTQMQLRLKIANCRMVGRDYTGYVQKFYSILKDLKDYGETDRVSQFLIGLPSDIRQQVFYRDPTDLSTAVNYGMQFFNSKQVDHNLKEFSSTVQFVDDPMDVDYHRHRRKQPIYRASKARFYRSPSPRRGRSTSPYRKGRRSRTPDRSSQRSSSQRSSSTHSRRQDSSSTRGTSRSSRQFICYNCGKPGHFAFCCKERKKFSSSSSTKRSPSPRPEKRNQSHHKGKSPERKPGHRSSN